MTGALLPPPAYSSSSLRNRAAWLITLMFSCGSTAQLNQVQARTQRQATQHLANSFNFPNREDTVILPGSKWQQVRYMLEYSQV